MRKCTECGRTIETVRTCPFCGHRDQDGTGGVRVPARPMGPRPDPLTAEVPLERVLVGV